MLKKLLFVLFLFVSPVFAQDVPKPRQWQERDAMAEIGKLYWQIQQLNEYIGTLQATVTQLRQENAKLKGEAK